jgi:carbonic anhydrase/acetyltransferase-like protein (isoleucine patch superfamily)
MPIYRLDQKVPAIHPDAYISPDAVIIGDVSVGPEASIWPGVVLRADHGTISIGAQTSIQDGSVIHCGPGFPTVIGERCVVGHIVHIKGGILDDDCLVGSGSVVLHYAHICSWAMVGANAVVPTHMEVPSDALALGVPAKIKEGGSNRELIKVSAAQYVQNVSYFKKHLHRVE